MPKASFLPWPHRAPAGRRRSVNGALDRRSHGFHVAADPARCVAAGQQNGRNKNEDGELKSDHL
jgi:hypothetical protein